MAGLNSVTAKLAQRSILDNFIIVYYLNKINETLMDEIRGKCCVVIYILNVRFLSSEILNLNYEMIILPGRC